MKKTAFRKVLLLSAISVLGTIATKPVMAEEAMTAAANSFLATLSPAMKAQATFAFDAEQRLSWHFIPNEMFPRSGVSLKQLSASQGESARALLRTGLSQRGYLTASAIIELERVLNALEAGGRFARDHEDYLVTVFGEPNTQGTWGWRFEGHHLSLHFTVVQGQLSVSTPSFFGSNPAQVREGAQTSEQTGQRVLAAREDTGRALIKALVDSQRAVAIIVDTAPTDIVTGNQYPMETIALEGLPASAMSVEQQSLMREIIAAYTDVMADEIATKRRDKIEADGIDSVRFAWAGSTEVGDPHYYRLQGPSFLIEYDNVQNGANHVHSVWRDFSGDFGADLLREHYNSVAH